MIRRPARKKAAARVEYARARVEHPRARPSTCVVCGGALDLVGSPPVSKPGDGDARADVALGRQNAAAGTGETFVPRQAAADESRAACTCRTDGGSVTAPGNARVNEAGLVLRPPTPRLLPDPAEPLKPLSGRPVKAPDAAEPPSERPAGSGDGSDEEPAPAADGVATAVAEPGPETGSDGDAEAGSEAEAEPGPEAAGQPYAASEAQAEHEGRDERYAHAAAPEAGESSAAPAIADAPDPATDPGESSVLPTSTAVPDREMEPAEPTVLPAFVAVPDPGTGSAESPAPPAAAADGGNDDVDGPTDTDGRRPARPPAPMLAAAVLVGIVLGSVPFVVSRVNVSDDDAQRTASHDIALGGTESARPGADGLSGNSGFIPRVNRTTSAAAPAVGRTDRSPTHEAPGRSSGSARPTEHPSATTDPDRTKSPVDRVPLLARTPSGTKTRSEPEKSPTTKKSPAAEKSPVAGKQSDVQTKDEKNPAGDRGNAAASADRPAVAPAPAPSPTPSEERPLEQVAGPGCQNTATASYQEHGRYEEGKDGWLGGSGDGPECGGDYASVPMSGDADVADPDISTTWTFDPGPRRLCTLYVFVPRNTDVSLVGGDPTHYTVFAGPEGNGDKITDFIVDQVNYRGYWIAQREFTTDGVFTIRLDNRGVDYAGDQPTYAHHAAAPIKASCH
jgi:translation initiation factor IF-2